MHSIVIVFKFTTRVSNFEIVPENDFLRKQC